MKLRAFLFILSFLICLIDGYTYTNIHQDTEIQKEKQQLDAPVYKLDIPSIFFKQPLYTHSSIKCYLKHIYNHPKYSPNFLSLNLSHLATFLSYNQQSELPRDYTGRVLGLFAQKLKATMYINGYAFCELLGQLPVLIKDQFAVNKEKEERLRSIKECIYHYLLSEFKTLKQNPDLALEQLSQQIYDLTMGTQATQIQDISIAKLQHITHSFLEISLNKLIWSPSDQQEIWFCVKEIAHHLEALLQNNIITDIEILDELYWSLIHRFCYMLELGGAELTDECFEIMNNDLITQKFSLWNLEERETFITSKIEHVRRALLQAQIKAKAYQAGIIASAANNTASAA